MPTEDTAPAFLTVAEAARLLRVTDATIRNRIRAGRLPAQRLAGGKAVLLDRHDVLAMLQGARAGLDPAPEPGTPPARLPALLAPRAQRLQAMAQTGLTYATDPYDRRRYEELRQIAADLMAAALGAPAPALLHHYALEDGYATPKVDVRGLVFRGDTVLLVRERADGLWTPHGGWADVGDTPSRAAEREIFEETGYTARAVQLLALLDRDAQGHPPLPYAAYKAFFRCEITGGAPALSDETDAVDFFPLDALPPLSTERITAGQLARLAELARDPHGPADFD